MASTLSAFNFHLRGLAFVFLDPSRVELDSQVRRDQSCQRTIGWSFFSDVKELSGKLVIVMVSPMGHFFPPLTQDIAALNPVLNHLNDFSISTFCV